MTWYIAAISYADKMDGGQSDDGVLAMKVHG